MKDCNNRTIIKAVCVFLLFNINILFPAEPDDGAREILLEVEQTTVRSVALLGKVVDCALTPITTTTTLYSGTYCLANDLNGVITIVGNDVELCLGGYTVYGGTHGIIIDEDVSTVEIRNGIVGPVADSGISVGAGCSRITLQDIVVVDCVGSGLSFVSTDSSRLISDVSIDSCHVSGCSTGLTTNNCNTISIRDSLFDNNGQQGALFVNSQCSQLLNCNFMFNAIGLQLEGSSKFVVEDCCALKNADEGFSLVQSFTNYFKKCKAIKTEGLYNVYAFNAESGGYNTFEECVAEGSAISGTDIYSDVGGFRVSSLERNSSLSACTVSNSHAPEGALSLAYGIRLEGCFTSLDWIANETPRCNNGASPTQGLFAVDWHPSDRYVALGGRLSGVFPLETTFVYGFDVSQTPTYYWIASATDMGYRQGVLSTKWTHDGRYLAVGSNPTYPPGPTVRVYEFDLTATATLNFIVAGSPYPTENWGVRGLRWTNDDRYLFAASANAPGTKPSIYVYDFDSVTPTLPLVANEYPWRDTWLYSVDLSPDERYAVVGGRRSPFDNHFVGVYEFDVNANPTLVWIACEEPSFDDNSPPDRARFAAWSPDGNYVAVGGHVAYDGNDLRVYKFDINATPTLHWIANANPPYDSTGVGEVLSIVWEKNGHYLVVGGEETSDDVEMRVYRFDIHVSPTLQLCFNANPRHGSDVNMLSNDNCYIAFSGLVSPIDNQSSRVYKMNWTYPFGCMVKDCTVFGTHGGNSVGITGDDINSLIINNLAYHNDTNYGSGITRVHSGYAGTPGYFDNISLQ